MMAFFVEDLCLAGLPPLCWCRYILIESVMQEMELVKRAKGFFVFFSAGCALMPTDIQLVAFFSMFIERFSTFFRPVRPI